LVGLERFTNFPVIIVFIKCGSKMNPEIMRRRSNGVKKDFPLQWAAETTPSLL